MRTEEQEKKYKESQKKYYQSHKQEQRLRWKKWNKNHKGKHNEYQKKWRKENPKRVKIRDRKYVETHRELVNYNALIRKIRMKKVKGIFTLQEWQDLKKKCDYTCQMCDKKEPEIKLAKDHIIPISKWEEWIKKHLEIKYQCNDIENIQPLCQSCNSKKGNKIIEL